MKPDKQVKKEFKLEASKLPDKYYATSVLKEEGFIRKKCKCGTYFWTVNPDQSHCGDPACSGGFTFIGNSPAKKELGYIELWKEFAALFKKLGYTPIKRYPVVARWRSDTEFVQASIYDFQPYVVSGQVEPPANPLVVPQFCLRFNDIDNVGVTGAHYTGFVMIGQHMFVPENKWDQARVFRDIHTWLRQGLGLPNKEITYHEDAWAGGGNFGPCMEYFSRGLELGNQVYMMFEQTPSGNRPLKLKVLDMGMGHERNAWFTKATSTSYESTFPTVAKKLYSISGIKVDQQMLNKFLPYASYLNVDEVDNIDKAWNEVAKKTGYEAAQLKESIQQLAALYSIGDHSRALLFALNDGALPSNVGGGYNLRVLVRRALSFISKYKWDLELPQLCEWHANYLKPLFPELSENLDNISKILEVENQKYKATKQKTSQIVQKIIHKKITEEILLQLYDSNGIAPELVKEEASKLGKNISIPDNFFSKISELHDKKQQVHSTKAGIKLDLDNIPETIANYYEDYTKTDFTAKVQKITNNYVVLDQTLFYPTSGGQLHDTGTINDQKVVDVFRQGPIIVHKLENPPKFKIGDKVQGKVDLKTRTLLSQHHTATHIVNAAARKVLGSHINQAGAKKTLEKAHLDITHYESLTREQLKQIEIEANKIVKSAVKINSKFYPRREAEDKFGMEIYQGGAVPGKKVRIVEIPGLDVEACGGTHLKNTSEVGNIKIIKSTKIQDGIIRLEYVAGSAQQKTHQENQQLIDEISILLNVKPEQIPARSEELFKKWKLARKAIKKKKPIDPELLRLVSTELFMGDILKQTAHILRTQPEHLPKTIKRFLKEIQQVNQK